MSDLTAANARELVTTYLMDKDGRTANPDTVPRLTVTVTRVTDQGSIRMSTATLWTDTFDKAAVRPSLMKTETLDPRTVSVSGV